MSQDLKGTVAKFTLVRVPGGSITVEDPATKAKKVVTLKPFWIATTETTWDIYDVYLFKLDKKAGPVSPDVDAISRPSVPYIPPDRGFGHTGFAAIHMASGAAMEFCKWLSATTGKKYRLPTEVEWEYAARAGAVGPGPTGAKALKDIAWTFETANYATHPTAKLKPNAWGLFDVLGNAGEWCVGMDGKPVVRGGSFQDEAAKVSFGLRQVQTYEWQQSDPQIPKSKWWLADAPFVGFRVVLDE